MSQNGDLKVEAVEPTGLSERLEHLERTVGSSLQEPSLQEKVRDLERRLSLLDGSNQQKESAQTTSNSPQKALIPEVRRVSWAGFKNRANEDDGRYAIEALYVGLDFRDEIRKEHMRRRRPESLHNVQGISKQLTEQELSRRRLYRVRIQSHAVLSILSQHLREDWDDEIRTFIRPFKIFLTLHDKMKASLEDLEHKWAAQEKVESETVGSVDIPALEITSSTPPTSPTISPASGRLDPLMDNDRRTSVPEDCVAALREMRCYMQFMENEIVPLKSRFTTHTVELPPKVRWDDLWCLFRPGQYLYTPIGPTEKTKTSPKNSQQVHKTQPGWQTVRKILNTASLELRFKAPGTKWKNNETDSEDEFEDDDPEEYLICDSDPEPAKDEYPFYIRCYHVDYDGYTYRPVFSEVKIDYYHGERPVDSLAAYPLVYAHEKDQLLEQLGSRGELFREYVQAPRLYYKGKIWNKNDTRYYAGEVVIDFEEAFKSFPTPPYWLNMTPYRVEYRPSQDDFPIKQQETGGEENSMSEIHEIIQQEYGIQGMEYNDCLREDAFLSACQELDKPGRNATCSPLELVDPVLLPQRMMAYLLRERIFCEVDVNSLRLMEKQMDAFDDLKIDASHKRLLRSLVHSHFQSKEVEKKVNDKQINQDIIQGKANNLIILLHGVPGVGKTATAEAIADVNDKPLFPITCGHLGISPSEVEQRLGQIFQLANRWNCVLLLDEADVFLAARRTEDLQRNALVSIFLTILEYYPGILILTTNRVGSMDEAFQSRVHLSLYYPRLSLEQTEEIFLMNIKRLKAIEAQRHATTGEPPIHIDEPEVMEFCKDLFQRSKHGRWNGRQIRNAFQNGASLARFQWSKENPKGESEVPPRLSAHQFETFATSIDHFRLYLKDTRGKEDWELAQEHNERADEFVPPPSYLDSRGNRQMYPDFYPPRRSFHTRRRNEDFRSYNGGSQWPNGSVGEPMYDGGRDDYHYGYDRQPRHMSRGLRDRPLPHDGGEASRSPDPPRNRY